jgi:hypothetical protein
MHGDPAGIHRRPGRDDRPGDRVTRMTKQQERRLCRLEKAFAPPVESTAERLLRQRIERAKRRVANWREREGLAPLPAVPSGIGAGPRTIAEILRLGRERNEAEARVLRAERSEEAA